jgi:hypothetical protein
MLKFFAISNFKCYSIIFFGCMYKHDCVFNPIQATMDNTSLSFLSFMAFRFLFVLTFESYKGGFYIFHQISKAPCSCHLLMPSIDICNEWVILEEFVGVAIFGQSCQRNNNSSSCINAQQFDDFCKR